jgi:hypothetical protein
VTDYVQAGIDVSGKTTPFVQYLTAKVMKIFDFAMSGLQNNKNIHTEILFLMQ